MVIKNAVRIIVGITIALFLFFKLHPLIVMLVLTPLCLSLLWIVFHNHPSEIQKAVFVNVILLMVVLQGLDVFSTYGFINRVGIQYEANSIMKYLYNEIHQYSYLVKYIFDVIVISLLLYIFRFNKMLFQIASVGMYFVYTFIVVNNWFSGVLGWY